MIPFDLIIRNVPVVEMDTIHFSSKNKILLSQFLKEHEHIQTLHQYGLKAANKVLLHGPSGCGKTSTALAIAHYLKKPIIITELSHLISAKIGETSKQVKSLFDKVNREKAILFLDEFDLIGKSRGSDDNDVGELRRLVNTIIQLIDYLSPDAILVAATNFLELIDVALLRRFELKIAYELPSKEELDVYYEAQLQRFPAHWRGIKRVYGCSYAEAKDHLEQAIKHLIIFPK